MGNMMEEVDEDELKAKSIAKEIGQKFPEVVLAVKNIDNGNLTDILDSDNLELLLDGLRKYDFVFLDLDNFQIIVGRDIPDISDQLSSLDSQPDPAGMFLFHKGRWLDWELIYMIKPTRYHLPDPKPEGSPHG